MTLHLQITAAFDRVLEASWQAGVIVLIVAAISPALARRLAPRWRCALWALVFIRLFLPALPPAPWSLFPTHASDPANSEQFTTTFGVIPTNASHVAPAAAMPIPRPAVENSIDWTLILS